MSDPHVGLANLVGALVDALSTAVDEATAAVSGQGGAAPAVLLALAQCPVEIRYRELVTS